MAWEEIGQNSGDKIRALEKQVEDIREQVYQAQYNIIGVGTEDANSIDSSVATSNILRGAATLSPLVSRRIDGEPLVDGGSNVSDTLLATDPYIIVMPKGTENPINIQWISLAQHDGQILILEPYWNHPNAEGTNTTAYNLVLKTGGNINISSDVTVARNEKIFLQWSENFPYYSGSSMHSSATTGSWTIVTQTSGGSSGIALGDNPTWTGNHIFQEDVTMGTGTDDDLTIMSAIKGHTVAVNDPDGGGTVSIADTVFVDANLDMNTWNIYDLDSLHFGIGTSSTNPAHDTDSNGIDADSDGLNFYTRSSDDFKWKINGSEKMRIDGGDSELRMYGIKLDMNQNRIENVVDPVNNQDAVNKQWFNANQSGGISAGDNVTWTGVHKFQNSLTELGNGGSDVIKIIGEIQGVSPWEDMQNPDGSGQNDYDIPSNGAGLNVDTSLILNTHNIYDIDQLVFARGASSLTPTWEADHIGIEFTQDNSYNDTGLGYHVDTGLRHRFFVYNNEILTMNNEGITAGGDAGGEGSNNYIGIHVSENTGKGTHGQIEGPYYYASSWLTSSSALNKFGNDSGSIGVVRNTSASSDYQGRFYFRTSDGWYQVQGTKVS